MKHAYTLFVKTGPACNAGCMSCPSGRKAPGDIEPIPLMKLDMFKRIVDRAMEQGTVISTVLHYLNEPTLNPHMPEIIAYAVSKDIQTNMSTNGSYPEKLKLCMTAGLHSLIFSVSGWSQAVHERSHKHTDIESIKQCMRDVSCNLKKGQFVRVGWHDYLYNRHEAPKMEELCKELGFKFTPYQTSVLPIEIVLDRFRELNVLSNLPELPAERDLITKLPMAKILCEQRKHYPCVIQQRMFAVDGNGMLYNCCAKGNAEGNRRESIFDIDLETFHERRKTDNDCLSCKAVAGHVYATQKHLTPLNWKWEVYHKLETVWRELGLGRFRRMVHMATSVMYQRPQMGDSMGHSNTPHKL